VETEDDVTGAGTFASSEIGSYKDNPTEPMTLDRLQRDKAVTLTFADVSSFEADLGNTGKKVSKRSHRGVMFAPKATLYCIGHLEEMTRRPQPTTSSTTANSGGAETTTKMSTDCAQIESKGSAADKMADLEVEAGIRTADDDDIFQKYEKSGISQENMFFTGVFTNLCTAFADASGTKHKVCIGARAGCEAKMVWKSSSEICKATGGLQFHNMNSGGESTVNIAVPTNDTILIQGTFSYQMPGFYDGQHMKLTLQGYKTTRSSCRPRPRRDRR
jgi:hypothetical protein